MWVRVSRDEESDCSDFDFDARHQHSTFGEWAPEFGIQEQRHDNVLLFCMRKHVFDGLTVILTIKHDTCRF